MAEFDLPHNISYRALLDLQTWERNYHVGNVDAIIRSIERFGFNGALRVWRGTVMAGNHALIALKAMRDRGNEPPKGLLADPAGGWYVATVALDHLSREEAEAFAIADNRTQELGQNDEEALAELMSGLFAVDHELALATGFSSAEIERMIKGEDTDPPNFEPGSSDEQGELDRTSCVKCPNCGHEFSPA